MTAPERSSERDAALLALLPRVPTQGWTMAALRDALADIGADRLDAELLFPGGPTDLIESFCDLADRWMEQDTPNLTAERLPNRVREVIARHLERLRPHREAVRRALAQLALPGRARLALRCTARTVDTIWHVAGDRTADFSWYTKRAILTGVYSATLLIWLRDDSEEDTATLAFLDRRLAGVARLHRARRRLTNRLARCRPGAQAEAA
jgi:ubiquinone biosynthesis protein COQ9